MDSRNLMINDWVHIAPTVKGRLEYDTQVYGIGPDVILVKRDSGANSIELNRVNAIPLTAEILEKNGWNTHKDAISSHCFRHKDVDFWLFASHKFTEYEITITKHTFEGDEDVVLCSIYNVHELQHALRLCGLRELAENFKI